MGLYPVKSDHADLAKVELAAEPVFTEHDIVSYDWKTHTLRLTAKGKKKLPQDTAVGVHGKRFVIVADGKRCYRGAFWTSFSSVPCEHPVIDVSKGAKEVRIERAYPRADFAKGEDPRPDERIRKVLKQTGKLAGGK
jgi:hypothetical protein